jgi:hypothetical protein
MSVNDASRGSYKTFMSVMYEFLYKARAFVPGKLFKPGLTNIAASYENLKTTDVKCYITIGPGQYLTTLEGCPKLWHHSLTTVEASICYHNMFIVQATQ